MQDWFTLSREMAQTAVQLDKQVFSCTICLDLLKDPATLPCGHNYCRSCIESLWDRQRQSSCPQCRQRFSPRPVLVTNTMLAELVEQLKRAQLLHSLKEFNLESDGSSEKTREQILHIIQDKETALQKLQQEALSFRPDEAVKHSEQSFNSVVQVLKDVHSEVTRQIKELQENEETKVKQLQDQLQQDITELRKTVSLTPGQSLQHCLPPSALDPPRTYSLPLGSLKQVATAVTALTDLLKATLKDGLQNISESFRADQHPSPQSQAALLLPELQTREEFINYAFPPPRPQTALSLPEPRTRGQFINYAREIVLDPKSAHPKLSLSRGNRRVTHDLKGPGGFRTGCSFTHFIQVLSCEGLTGRCYWEVEWDKFHDIVIAVSYKNIQRYGDSEDSEFGFNDKSWAFQGKQHVSSFWHHSVETEVKQQLSDIIGVYLDHSAGVLAFYNINKKFNLTNLIHRVQTTFTQPVFAGVRFFEKSKTVTAYFPKLK